jgi:hypothetical protein
MPREITDEEYNWLQGRRQVADLADSVWNDPILGREAKALLKKKMPNVQIPDHDIRQEMNDRFQQEEERRIQERNTEQQQREDQYWRTKRSETQKKHNLSDDEIKDLEKFMLENNVGDYGIAAEYRAAKAPRPSTPTQQREHFWNHGKGDVFKEIAKDPEEWGRNEIMQALIKEQNKAPGSF